MNALTVIILIFSAFGAVDWLIGNKLGAGREFERAFGLFAPMALSMLGMIVIAPAIGAWLTPFFEGFYSLFKIDPSILPASILASGVLKSICSLPFSYFAINLHNTELSPFDLLVKLA